MITLILCLRPLRVPKFIWFKILHKRRFEFGEEMIAQDKPNDILVGAAKAGNAKLVRLALDWGAYVFSKALYTATKHNHNSIAYKLAKKCHPNNPYLEKSVRYAAQHGNILLIHYFIYRDLATAIECAEEACYHGQMRLLLFLIRKIKNRKSCMEKAIAGGQQEIINFLKN
jgi:hypothetical protein